MYRRADGGDPWATPSYGIPIRGLAQDGIGVIQYEANVTITGNTVYNMGLAGILSGGNDGTTIIEDNFVHIVSSDPEINPFIGGIEAWGKYFYDSYATAKYVIADNDVTVGGGQEAAGIYVDWTKNAPVVRDNRIKLTSPAAKGILLEVVSNANVAGNEIEGDGQYGLVLGKSPDPIEVNKGNTLTDNVLERFTAAASVYLGEGVANNILYLKEQDKVLDESGNDTNMVAHGG
jgi:hypothetical protein